MRLPRIPEAALALAATLALSACVVPGGPLDARDSVVETRSLDPEGRFSLENVNGKVELSTWSRPEVRIEADRAAVSDAALEDVRVEISGEGSEVRVKTRFLRSGFPFMGRSGKVDYRVTVPAGARVHLSTVNGPVSVEGVAGELRVSSVNGSVTVRDASGAVEAETVNGGIDAAYAVVPASGSHHFETVNGGIEVSLPEGSTGRLAAKTVNGSVSCELPIDNVQKSRRRLQGRLGPGEGSFQMETVNGSVHVRRGPGRPPAEAS